MTCLRLALLSLIFCYVYGYLGGKHDCELMGERYGNEFATQSCQDFTQHCQAGNDPYTLFNEWDRQQTREEVSRLSKLSDCYGVFYDDCISSCERGWYQGGDKCGIKREFEEDLVQPCNSISVINSYLNYSCSQKCKVQSEKFTMVNPFAKEKNLLTNYFVFCEDTLVWNGQLIKGCNLIQSHFVESHQNNAAF